MVYVFSANDEQYAALTSPTSSDVSMDIPVRSAARRTKELVLVQYLQQCTHTAAGETGAGRLTLRTIRRLPRAVPLLELPALIPRRLQAHSLRVLHAGGRFPPKTGEAIRAALAHIFPEHL